MWCPLQPLPPTLWRLQHPNLHQHRNQLLLLPLNRRVFRCLRGLRRHES